MTDTFLQDLTRKLRDFARERDWEQFHTPKNLATALSVEVAELQEIFQWLTPESSANLSERERQRVGEEAADVLLYLLRLADVLNLDLEQAVLDKLALNARKYPVELARGRADKYDVLAQVDEDLRPLVDEDSGGERNLDVLRRALATQAADRHKP